MNSRRVAAAVAAVSLLTLAGCGSDPAASGSRAESGAAAAAAAPVAPVAPAASVEPSAAPSTEPPAAAFASAPAPAATADSPGGAPPSAAGSPPSPAPEQRATYLASLDKIDPQIIGGDEEQAVGRGLEQCRFMAGEHDAGKRLESTAARFTGATHPNGFGPMKNVLILAAVKANLCPAS
ncbi:hypothetical protein AB0953_17610 [Streptomyces sp. NPDC046866]|uniref:hypothetical protein n=1 Tax=Streptomyces sp. NPDC046866 TaxID=3154921 RepID=UPI0034561EF5